MEESSGHKKQLIAVLAVLIVIAVIVGGAIALNGKDESHNRSHASTSTESQAQAVQTDANATYKDGTYQAEGSYVSPGGNEEITISVTVKDGVITDTSAQNGAHDVEAKEHQEDFIESYKSEVVGKKLSVVSLSRVSGSSLTSQGFNDAIQQIRDQAEV